MLSLTPSVRIYLHAKPIDMRNSFDGLFGIVKNEFSMDVRNGGLFLFINLRRNRVNMADNANIHVHWIGWLMTP